MRLDWGIRVSAALVARPGAGSRPCRRRLCRRVCAPDAVAEGPAV